MSRSMTWQVLGIAVIASPLLLSCQAAPGQLGASARAAVTDFREWLVYLGATDGMEQKHFEELVEGVTGASPYDGAVGRRLRNGTTIENLFEDLWIQSGKVTVAHTVAGDDSVRKRVITPEALEALYSSPTGSYGDALGHSADMHLLSELDSMYEDFSIKTGKAATAPLKDDWVAAALGYHEFPSQKELPDSGQSSPTAGTPPIPPMAVHLDALLQRMKKYALGHFCNRHHFLDVLSRAGFGQQVQARMIIRFVLAYKHALPFLPALRKLRQNLAAPLSAANGSEEYRIPSRLLDLVDENLEQKSKGQYSEEDIREVIKQSDFTDGGACFVGTPHPQLLTNFIVELAQRYPDSWKAETGLHPVGDLGEELSMAKSGADWGNSLIQRSLTEKHRALGQPLRDVLERVFGLGDPASSGQLHLDSVRVAEQLAVLCFGGETLAPLWYSQIAAGIKRLPVSDSIVPGGSLGNGSLADRMRPEDFAFYLVHTEVEASHVGGMLEVFRALVDSEQLREAVVRGASALLEARVGFLDGMMKSVHEDFPDFRKGLPVPASEAAASVPGAATGARDGNVDKAVKPDGDRSSVVTKEMYGSDLAKRWKREKPKCLSDFTGRPHVFEIVGSMIRAKSSVSSPFKILDLGCGEGYCARKFLELGATQVVGVDVSPSMISLAEMQANAAASAAAGPTKQQFFVGSAPDAAQILKKNWRKLGMLPDKVEKTFDLVTAVFLFNYLTISEMRRATAAAAEMLTDGGSFVFSVPHPLLAHGDASSAGGEKTFSFEHPRSGEGVENPEGLPAYFAMRDKMLRGQIYHMDAEGHRGNATKVMMMYKCLEDYTQMLDDLGFDIVQVREAGVTAEHLAQSDAFFGSVNDRPLHLIFHTRLSPRVHPVVTSTSTKRAADRRNSILSRKLLWPSWLRPEANNRACSLDVQRHVQSEIADLVKRLHDKNVTAESFHWSGSGIVGIHDPLKATRKLAAEIRRRLTNAPGVVLLRGLNLTRLESLGSDGPKLAYYLLCSLVGEVDGAQRGRLFDVTNRGVHPLEDANTLFFVSDNQLDWHTDGASWHVVYDAVALMCLSQAASGGDFKVTNSASAWQSLERKLPRFLLYELTRPLPRDILEDGAGVGSATGCPNEAPTFPDPVVVSRHDNILPYRARVNAFPIFEDDSRSKRFRMRYMRHWVETGHARAGLALSPLLSVAMDALDAELDAAQVLTGKLAPGEILFESNAATAHARKAFVDAEGARPRHLSRVRLTIQQAAAWDEDGSSSGHPAEASVEAFSRAHGVGQM